MVFPKNVNYFLIQHTKQTIFKLVVRYPFERLHVLKKKKKKKKKKNMFNAWDNSIVKDIKLQFDRFSCPLTLALEDYVYIPLKIVYNHGLAIYL